MQSKLIDTNVFIRYFAKDDDEKSLKSSLLFEKLERGEISMRTTESIICKVIYVLKNIYSFSREDISKYLRIILSIKTLTFDNKAAILEALKIYSKNKLDMEDYILQAKMKVEEIKEIYSYDRDFDKLEGIIRLEP